MAVADAIFDATEQRFGVRFAPGERATAGSLLGVHQLLLEKLCVTGPHQGFRRALVFYRLRRALVEALGVPKRDLRPDTDLGALLPPDQRHRHWEKLGASGGLALPPLEPTVEARRWAGALPLALLILLGLPVSCMCPWVGLPFVVVMALVAVGMQDASLRRSLGRSALLPEGVQTLRDLVDQIAAPRLREDVCAGEQLFWRLRRAVAAAGAPVGRLRPDDQLGAVLPRRLRAQAWPAVQEALDACVPDLALPWWAASSGPLILIGVIGAWSVALWFLVMVLPRHLGTGALVAAWLLSPTLLVTAAWLGDRRLLAWARRCHPLIPRELPSARRLVQWAQWARAQRADGQAALSSTVLLGELAEVATEASAKPPRLLKRHLATPWHWLQQAEGVAAKPPPELARQAVAELLAAYLRGGLCSGDVGLHLRALPRGPADPLRICLLEQFPPYLEEQASFPFSESAWDWLRRVVAALRAEAPLTRVDLDALRGGDPEAEPFRPFWSEQQWRQYEPLVADIPLRTAYHAIPPAEREVLEATLDCWGITEGYWAIMVEQR